MAEKDLTAMLEEHVFDPELLSEAKNLKVYYHLLDRNKGKSIEELLLNNNQLNHFLMLRDYGIQLSKAGSSNLKVGNMIKVLSILQALNYHNTFLLKLDKMSKFIDSCNIVPEKYSEIREKGVYKLRDLKTTIYENEHCDLAIVDEEKSLLKSPMAVYKSLGDIGEFKVWRKNSGYVFSSDKYSRGGRFNLIGHINLGEIRDPAERLEYLDCYLKTIKKPLFAKDYNILEIAAGILLTAPVMLGYAFNGFGLVPDYTPTFFGTLLVGIVPEICGWILGNYIGTKFEQRPAKKNYYDTREKLGIREIIKPSKIQYVKPGINPTAYFN